MSSPLRLTILCSALLAAILGTGCADDPPQRPEDGSVGPYETCVWEHQAIPELCLPFLGCPHGLCVPQCNDDSDCPVFDGFESFCASVCYISCNDKQECPDTNEADFVENGAPLVCAGACTVEW